MPGPLTATGPVRIPRDDGYGSPLSTTLRGNSYSAPSSGKRPLPAPVKYVKPNPAPPAYQPETVYYKDTYSPAVEAHSPAPSYSAPGPPYEAEESGNGYRDESSSYSGEGVFDSLVPLMNLLYPSTIVGGIGMLTMAFYIKQVDDAYNRTLTKFQKVHNNTDYR